MPDKDLVILPEKKTLREELKLPSSTAEIRADVQNGELNPFEIEKVIVNADTTIETRQALAMKQTNPALLSTAQLPAQTLLATELKLKQLTTNQRQLAKKRAVQKTKKYQTLQIPGSRTKTAAEKRDAKKLDLLKRKYRLSIHSGRPKGHR